MSDNKSRKMIPASGGFVAGLTDRVKLIVRLIADSRVNPLLKLLPIGSFVYLVIPDIVVGPVDDAAILWLGTYLFVELCPPDVVEEHMKALKKVIPGQWQETQPANPDEEIVEGEFWEVKK